MAYGENRQIAFGDVMAGTFALLRQNWRSVLIYLAAMGAINAVTTGLASLSPVLEGVFGVATVFAGFAAQYLLFRAMLRQGGQMGGDARFKYFQFIGMAIIVLFAVMFGYVLLVIPGLIIGSRWLAAPCYLIATDRGTFGSLGASWEAVGGRTTPIAFAALVIIIGGAVLLGAVGGVIGQVTGGALAQLQVSLGFQIFWAVMIAFSVGVFGLINDDKDAIAEVFA